MTAGVTQVAAWRRDSETEASWPGSAPANPGAGHRIPLLSENVTKEPQFQDRGVLFGQVSQEEGKLAGFTAGGTIECDLRYGGLDRLFAAALGFENPNTDADGGSPHLLATGEYQHAYECHEDLRSLVWSSSDRNASTGTSGQPGHWLATHRKQCRGGFYVSKGVSDWRLWPAMVEAMEITVNPRSSRVTFDLVGYNLERGSYGSASWTAYNDEDYNSDPGVSQVLLHQLTAQWGSAGVGSWTGTLGVTSLTIRVQNNLKADDFDSAGGKYILEPWRQGMRQVTGSVSVSRYTDDSVAAFLDFAIGTQWLFDFVGPSLGTNNARLAIGIPAAKVTRVSSPVGGPEVVQQQIDFEAYEPATISSVFTGAGTPWENITLTQNNNGKPGEILLATTNTYDQNVFEND